MEQIVVNVIVDPIAQDLPLPEVMTEGSAGADLRAALEEPVILQPGQFKAISTGLRLEIPVGYEGQIRPRSGLAIRYGISQVNAPGTIDSDYRGVVQVLLINHGKEAFTVNHGDRIAQLVIAPVVRPVFQVQTELTDTARGAGGFGHTGKS